ncbi:MAG: flagellar export protein FliJ [Bdellovibrionota bacterium]|jgi:flagellar export protein FliJ
MPKKFKFRLQRVLEYRKVVKDERQKELIERNHEVRRLQEKQEQIMQSLDEARVSASAMTGHLVRLLGEYTARLRSELHANKELLVEALQEQREALVRYQEAAREEEVLKRLKEKKLAIHAEKYLKEEADFLDEIGTLKGNAQYGEE